MTAEFSRRPSKQDIGTTTDRGRCAPRRDYTPPAHAGKGSPQKVVPVPDPVIPVYLIPNTATLYTSDVKKATKAQKTSGEGGHHIVMRQNQGDSRSLAKGF
jgi:hypothetical protein